MNKIPFKRFVITFLLFGKAIGYIVDKLESFGYNISDAEVSDAFDELTDTLPADLAARIREGHILSLENESHVQWLNHFGVFEYYDYILNHHKIAGSTDDHQHFKWCDDCLWAHGHRDVMSLINIFLFNKEDLEEISKIVMFRYRKKVGVDALELYQRMFWDTEGLSAKEALFYCKPFMNNALIVRKFRSGLTELETIDGEAGDGSDVPITFHDTNYIKWKIGYREFEVPTPGDFMRRVQEDSYFKYLETMSMTRSVEIEEEEGSNDKIGNFDSTKTKKRNVEEQRVKMAKHWLDVYLKAHESMPTGGPRDDDFFDKMEELELGYEDEKIVSIEDNKSILDEITGDMNPISGDESGRES